MNKMEEELLNLIYYYCHEIHPIDYTFLNEILNIFINYHNLSSSITNFTLDSKSTSSDAAEYFLYSKKLIVYEECLKRLFVLPKGRSFNCEEIILSPYLASVAVLAHESTHAYHTTIKDENSIESKVINANLEALNPNRHYDLEKISHLNPRQEALYYERTKAKIEDMIARSKTYYAYSPTERLANIYAYKLILKLLKEIAKKTTVPNLTRLYEEKLYNAALSGYDSKRNPTKYYLKKMGVSKLWGKINEMSQNEPLATRITLGLNISKSEYQRVLSLKNN